MTPEERTRQALDRCFDRYEGWDRDYLFRYVEEAIRQAIQDEREACAKLLDDSADRLEGKVASGLELIPRGYAQDIRNRK